MVVVAFGYQSGLFLSQTVRFVLPDSHDTGDGHGDCANDEDADAEEETPGAARTGIKFLLTELEQRGLTSIAAAFI